MKKIISIAAVLLVYISSPYIIYAQNIKVENPILQKALESMAPKLHDSALSATFVRTTYTPQPLSTYVENKHAKIQRTITSELTVNYDGVKESIYDARAVEKYTKQYTLHHSNNGRNAKTYDSKNNRGTTRKSSKAKTNYLSLAVSPDLLSRQHRFVSRSTPLFLNRLNGAIVTSETAAIKGGQKCITLEGQYQNSDPEQYFKITVIPSCGYAVAELEEYDKHERILTKMNASDFGQTPGHSATFWLPKHTSLAKYTYDSYEDDTIQIAKLEILEPKVVPVYEDTFDLTFPNDARIYDATIGMRLDGFYEEADKISLAAIDDVPLNKTTRNKKGGSAGTINTAHVTKGNNLKKPPMSAPQNRILSTSKSEPNPITIKILQAFFMTTVGVIVFFVIRRKFNTGNTCENMKGGDFMHDS